MKAGVLYQNESLLKIEEVKLPELKPNQVKVDIKCCGFVALMCMTIHKQVRLSIIPTILGHEAAGVIKEIGESVYKI